MCQVSDKLKLCTYTTPIEDLKNYWVFHRYNDAKQQFVIGEAMFPALISAEDEAFNQSLLMRLLNEGNVFDTDLRPADKDRLQLSFYITESAGIVSDIMHYGFAYSNGQWQAEDFGPLEWRWKHDKESSGEIENPLR